MSDNFHFDLTGVPLGLCLRVAFCGERWAVGWSELLVDEGMAPMLPGKVQPLRLVLYWTHADGMTPFPVKMNAEQVEPLIQAWLADAKYGPQPDHDGDNEKGWRVYNESWGRVAGKFEAFVAIEPRWLMYGK